jgi:nickel-dependent lactate racemase
MLANKVMKGSKGVWGSEEMPSHPDLDVKKTGEMVQWILNSGADSNVNYLPGLEGSFHTALKPGDDNGKAVYVLTASYTDHGTITEAGQEKQTKHSVVIRSSR